jgi:hypothetical protein
MIHAIYHSILCNLVCILLIPFDSCMVPTLESMISLVSIITRNNFYTMRHLIFISLLTP